MLGFLNSKDYNTTVQQEGLHWVIKALQLKLLCVVFAV